MNGLNLQVPLLRGLLRNSMNDNNNIVQLVLYELGMTDTLPELDYTNLIKAGIVKFEGNDVKVSILKIKSLDVVDDDTMDSFVKKFRNKFKAHPQIKGNLGDRAKTKDRLKWLMLETGLSLEEVEEVTDKYIKECVETNRYLMDPHHFLWKSEGSKKRTLADSKLWSVYQDMLDTDEEVTSKTTYEL